MTRLLAADLREHDIGSVTEAIAANGRDYDQLATYPGEREEWVNLQGILRRLITSLPGTPRSRTDRLVSINLEGSRTNIASIRAVDRQAVVSDALVGGAALTADLP